MLRLRRKKYLFVNFQTTKKPKIKILPLINYARHIRLQLFQMCFFFNYLFPQCDIPQHARLTIFTLHARVSLSLFYPQFYAFLISSICLKDIRFRYARLKHFIVSWFFFSFSFNLFHRLLVFFFLSSRASPGVLLQYKKYIFTYGWPT